jgi:2-oxoglutarate ferredoxin oxidoreductase subunit delta
VSKITVFRQACKGVDGCGICIFVCPNDLFCASEEINEAGYLPPRIKGESECKGCMNCMIYCPDFAIVMEKDSQGVSARGENEDE